MKPQAQKNRGDERPQETRTAPVKVYSLTSSNSVSSSHPTRARLLLQNKEVLKNREEERGTLKKGERIDRSNEERKRSFPFPMKKRRRDLKKEEGNRKR